MPLPEGMTPVSPTLPEGMSPASPLPEGMEQTGQLTMGTQAGEPLTQDNYGRVAAAAMARNQRQRQAAGGGNLSPAENAAILDTYRRAVGLPTLSNVDSFQESQKFIAKHQSDLENLAQSTSAAFQRQAVNFVAPAIDQISPDWGRHIRQDIAAASPFDPDRVSGKAGPTVASLPLLLAGGNVQAAAAVFGLQSTTESLANSDDAGRHGIMDKWAPAVGAGAITAGSVLAGGKIAEWVTKSLGNSIPQLKALLTVGGEASVRQVIAREAALAGVSLPPNAIAMMSGTVADNLLAQQTTDPNRKWDDGLVDTGMNIAAMTIANHIGRATAGALKASPGETGKGDIKGTPEPDNVTITPRNSLTSSVSPTGEVQIAANVPRTVEVDGTTVDLHQGLKIHEETEAASIAAGKSQPDAHIDALTAEHDYYRSQGVDPAKVEAVLSKYEDQNSKTPAVENPPMIPAHEELAASGRDEPERTPAEAAEYPTLGQRIGTVISNETGAIDPDKLIHAIIGEPSKVDTRSFIQKGKDFGKAVVNDVRAMSGQMFPEMVSRSPELADEAAKFVSAKSSADVEGDFIARSILGQGKGMQVDPLESHMAGTAATEDRLRSKFIKLARAGQMDAAAEVGTLIGKKNSPFLTEEAFEKYLADRRTAELQANIEQHWGPRRDELYRSVTGLSDSKDSTDPDLRTHVFMNTVPVNDASSSPTAIEVRPRTEAEMNRLLSKSGISAGGLTNTMRKKASIQRPFTGTAPAYETDLGEMIKSTLRSSGEIAARNNFIDAGVRTGHMVEGPPGQLPQLPDGETLMRLPDIRRVITQIDPVSREAKSISANRDIGVRKSLYDEVRGAFNVDTKSFSRSFEPISRVLNSLALTGPTEMMWHSANLLRPVWKYWGIRTPFILGKEALRVWGNDFKAQGVIADLAQSGASVLRSGDPSGSILRRATGKTLDFIGRISHLALEDAYQKIVRDHPELDSPTARRDFHNQTGNYNERAMPYWAVAAKRTFAPFLTAGGVRLTRAIMNLGLSPGIKAKNLSTAIRLRMNVLGNYASILALIPAINFFRHGRWDGADDIPFGSIRLDDSPEGKHRYFDLLQMIGVRSGLRATGANAAIESGHKGLSLKETLDQASKEAVGQLTGPLEGPALRTAITAAGGNPYTPKAAKDESQAWENMKTAVKDVNPVAGWLMGTKGPGGAASTLLGPYAPREAPGKSTALQIATREAAANVPPGQQTRAQIEQTQREHEYRKEWTAGNQSPLIQALQRGEINTQRARELVSEASMSDLARTVHHLPIDVSLRIYDAATPAEKADLKQIMLQHISNLAKSSPMKAKPMIEEYKSRGLL